MLDNIERVVADIVGTDDRHGENGYSYFDERTGRSLILACITSDKRLLDRVRSEGVTVIVSCPVEEEPNQKSRKLLMVLRLAALWFRRGNVESFRVLRLWRFTSGVSFVAFSRNFLNPLKWALARDTDGGVQ